MFPLGASQAKGLPFKVVVGLDKTHRTALGSHQYGLGFGPAAPHPTPFISGQHRDASCSEHDVLAMGLITAHELGVASVTPADGNQLLLLSLVPRAKFGSHATTQAPQTSCRQHTLG